MHFGVISLFPGMFRALLDYGVVGRALDQGLASLDVVNPRDFATDRHGSVDDRPYGGGPGMVMAVEPLCTALGVARTTVTQRIGDAHDGSVPTVLLSAQGRRLDYDLLGELSAHPGLVLIAGRYEGVDERLLDEVVDLECSIGDFVVSGGELPAMVLLDALVRLLPGALGHADSAQEDSFVDGLLDCPHYTRPEVWRGRQVPAVLRSGDHGAIRRWRLGAALERTWMRRPDLLAGRPLSTEEAELLAARLAGADQSEEVGPEPGAG